MKRIVLPLALLGTVAVIGSGCLVAPAPVPVVTAPPPRAVVVAPPPVVVAPAPVVVVRPWHRRWWW